MKMYARLVGGGLVAGMVLVLITALYMQPVVGELTRLGGYLENRYGWVEAQERFTEPLFEHSGLITGYDRYYDVVVLGDSFSEDRARGWQNYLVAKTGWSLITLNMNDIKLDELLEHATFRAHPPKVFIYESVERNTVIRNPVCGSVVGDYVAPRYRLPPSIPQHVDVLRESRDTSRSVSRAQLGFAVNYLKKRTMREVPGLDRTEVRRFSLSKPGLFSSPRSDELLAITRDFLTQGVSQAQIETVGCRLLEIQTTVLGSGVGAFAAMIFPDKTALYSDFIVDDGYQNPRVGLTIERTPNLVVARLSHRFIEAVESGVVDLYLPNDTHCGFAGYQLAAEELLRVLHDFDNRSLSLGSS